MAEGLRGVPMGFGILEHERSHALYIDFGVGRSICGGRRGWIRGKAAWAAQGFVSYAHKDGERV